MEFLHVFIALFLNISMTISSLSVVTWGFLETILTSGIPLNVGSAHTLSSQPPRTLLGSPDTLMKRLFFCFFVFFCFILPLSTQRGVFFGPQPNFNLHNFNSWCYIENACSTILVLTRGNTLKWFRELFQMPFSEIQSEFVWAVSPGNQCSNVGSVLCHCHLQNDLSKEEWDEKRESKELKRGSSWSRSERLSFHSQTGFLNKRRLNHVSLWNSDNVQISSFHCYIWNIHFSSVICLVNHECLPKASFQFITSHFPSLGN